MQPTQPNQQQQSLQQHEIELASADSALRSSNSASKNLIFFNDLKRRNILEEQPFSKGTSTSTFSFGKQLNSHQQSISDSHNQFQCLAEAATYSIRDSSSPLFFASKLTKDQNNPKESAPSNSNNLSPVLSASSLLKPQSNQPQYEDPPNKPLYKIVQEEKEKKVLARLEDIKRKMRDSPLLSEFDTQLIHAYTSTATTLTSPANITAVASIANHNPTQQSPEALPNNSRNTNNNTSNNKAGASYQQQQQQVPSHKFRSSLLSGSASTSQLKSPKQLNSEPIQIYQTGSNGLVSESDIGQKYEEEIRRLTLQHRLRSEEQENTIRQLKVHLEVMEERSRLSLAAASDDLKRQHYDILDKERASRAGVADLRSQYTQQIDSLQEQLKAEKDNSLNLSRKLEDIQLQFKEHTREMTLQAKNAEKEFEESKRAIQQCVDEVEDRIAHTRRMKDTEHAIEVQKINNVWEGKVDHLELDLEQATQQLREQEMRSVDERQYYLNSEQVLKEQMRQLEDEVRSMKREQDILVEKSTQFESIIHEVEDDLKNARLEVQQLQAVNRELETENASLQQQQNTLKPKLKKTVKNLLSMAQLAKKTAKKSNKGSIEQIPLSISSKSSILSRSKITNSQLKV